jgi:Zn-dependent alcohol dehydrogenase
MVLGHEFGGDIVTVGKGESRFKPGMRVTANVFGECGECFFCQKGQGNLCENLEYNFGAYASYQLRSSGRTLSRSLSTSVIAKQPSLNPWLVLFTHLIRSGQNPERKWP